MKKFSVIFFILFLILFTAIIKNSTKKIEDGIFTAKFYLYGPVTSQSVIKSVQVDQFTDMPDKSPKREQRYTVTPDPVTAEFDDNFGFNETTSFFQDAKDFNPETGSDE